MSKPITIDLGTIADISAGGQTPSFKLDEQYGWGIAPTVVGVPSTAKYTVRVSMDNVVFYDYKIAAVDVPIEDPVEDNTFNWNYIAVLVTPGGISSGTAQFNFQGKR